MSAGRSTSTTGRLARLGFADPPRAERFLGDPALAGLFDPAEDLFDDGLLPALAATADADQALLGLVGLLEAFGRRDDVEREDDRDGVARLHAQLRSGGPTRDRLLAVLGASAALGEHLAHHPEHWHAVDTPAPEPGGLRRDLVAAVGADPTMADPVAAEGFESGQNRLRVAYRRALVSLAARDLSAPDPSSEMPAVARELAELAGAALEAALAVARAELPDRAPACRLAIIGMGKCGGGELNYVSDVDVVYVAEPMDGQDEQAALDTATRLASAAAKACGAVTAEGTLWPVDAGLRPEGRNGPLVRTLASHLVYYDRWAKTWEFQALLKARPIAGDLDLGRAFCDAVDPLVWSASEREGFVPAAQAMRRRVEENVPARDADRQLKLGPGGLRDVEFSVQLLQLVHGRADPSLRGGTTLPALEALQAGGYVAREDAATLDASYRFLRSLEHRIQLFRLRRTHVVPAGEADLRRLGRVMGLRGGDVAEQLVRAWRGHQRQVRQLHERLFYRPLLDAVARLGTDEVRLTPDAARVRLAALGYRDPKGALRHLETLTSGMSRRAAIQRTLLPVMLEWFASGADPDAGLLSFRRVSDELGSTHWYLKMLRDSRAAAERLAHVLASSRYAGELLEKGPDAVAMLAADADLAPRTADALRAEVRAAASRQGGAELAATAVRAVRRRELLRTSIADLVGLADLDQVGVGLSAAAAAALAGALQIAERGVQDKRGEPLRTRLLVIGMGRLGGAEMGYGSDADVLFVHEPESGADEGQAQQDANAVVTELRRLLGAAAVEPALEVDAGLRPEGRSGPMVRSLASYAEYYRRWAQPWEVQALLRAESVAGDDEVWQRFRELVDPLRWPVDGLPDAGVREVRRIKARVEAERLPRGVDPTRHLKLGPGGMADVEWTAQLLQLQHAGRHPSLRTTSTTGALRAAVEVGVLDAGAGRDLEAAWRLASTVRNALVLWRGRSGDVLPTDVRDLDGTARIAGYGPGSTGLMDEEWRRATRRARTVVESVFYAWDRD